MPLKSIRLLPERTKGKVLSVQPRHRREKQHRDSHFGRPRDRDSHFGRPRDLIAFKVYPFTPGENQKARFYLFSPGTGGRSSTAIRILAGTGGRSSTAIRILAGPGT